MPERLAERVWFSNSQSLLLNIYFLLSEFQSSRIPIHTIPKCGTEPIPAICHATLSRSAQRIFVAEIALKSPFLCVNKSPMRSGFRAGKRNIFHSLQPTVLSLDFLHVYRLEYTRQDTSKKQEMGVDGPSPDLRVRVLFYIR